MRRVLPFLLLAPGLSACRETPVALFGSVAVSFATSATPAVPLSPIPAPRVDTVTAGADTLVIESVEVVLREIDFEPALVADCDLDPKPDGCEEVEIGPVLVDLPLVPGVAQQFDVQIPPGTYVEIEFEVHKPSDDDVADSVFLAAHPEFADSSIRVRGTFNGAAFSYTTDLNVEQELMLAPPLDVVEAEATNVTIFVDVSTWFVTATGALVDPATANKGGTNANLVRDNIIGSFRAFEDRDGDGDDGDETP